LGLVKIEDDLVYDYTSNPNMSGNDLCGQNAGGACLVNANIDMGFGCEPDPCTGRWVPVNVTLYVTGTLRTYIGDFDRLVTPPRDRAIDTPLEAASHEHSAHLEPAIRAVMPLAEDFERDDFDSAQQCADVGEEVNGTIKGRFKDVRDRT
jgi:hypothetical protein